MIPRRAVLRGSMIGSVILAAACQDLPEPTAPADQIAESWVSGDKLPQLAIWFDRASPAVLALGGTVFADHDEEGGRLVFGVEDEGVIPEVQSTLARLGVPASAYTIKVTEPIYQLATLRDRFRPTLGGIQIHFGLFLCTLGFNVHHAAGRSFITNSHCTEKQGGTEGTEYFQPTSSVDPTVVAIEADDPQYFKGGECPRGRKCRYSDAARARYQTGIDYQSAIAKTTGVNDGSLDVAGSFDITGQDNTGTTFAGTMNKVGRTTGWTQGTVSATCIDVNVAGSNITQLCQTLVQADQQIVAGGDSGSPVFTTDGASARLVGILWGGSSSGETFVFSPLKNIQDELGALDAINADGTGDGSGGGGGGGGGNCPPNSKSPNCS